MKTVKFALKSTSPFLMHSAQTVDPLNPYTRAIKAVTDKGSKKMTESDHAELYRLKWESALYLSAESGPYIPADMMLKALREGGTRSRKGKDIERATNILVDEIPLQYDGPRDVKKLYGNGDTPFVFIKDARPNKTGGRVMSCRPIFRSWTAEVEIVYDESLVNRDTVIDAMVAAGQVIGIGNWRPRFGRFEVAAIDGKAVKQAA